MLRKIIMLAITSGLAKKAWDSYQGNRGVAASGGTGRMRRTSATPVKSARIITPDNRPDAF
jgi:hypothetical protein